MVLTRIWLLQVILGQGFNINWNIIYDLLISSDKSQRSKLDFTDFENNFYSDLTPFICSGRIGFTPEKILQWIWGSYYWLISMIMGNWAKPDLSDLGYDL